MENNQEAPRKTPSVKQVLGLLAFVVALALFRWLEHVWMLKDGQYAGVGLHSRYLNAWTVGVVVLGVGWFAWKALRRGRP